MVKNYQARLVGTPAVIAILLVIGLATPHTPMPARIASVIGAILVAAVLALHLRTVRGARAYLRRIGDTAAGHESTDLPVHVRVRTLWMPLAAPYRVWFQRSLVAFLTRVGCALTAFAVSLAEGPIPGSVPVVRPTLVALESVLGALGYVISFVVVACLIAGIWSYLHGGRSETATERTFRP